jgi:hypothetical protein
MRFRDIATDLPLSNDLASPLCLDFDNGYCEDVSMAVPADDFLRLFDGASTRMNIGALLDLLVALE